MNHIIEKIRNAIQPVLTNNGYEIVDIELTKQFDEQHLTIYLYTPEGMSLDHCEKAHYLVTDILDELNPTNDRPYVLNISSPGLDRPFKTQRDYERNYGTEVELKLYAPQKGKKVFEGVLVLHDESVTVIKTNEDEIKLCNNAIAFVRPLVKFS